MERTMLTFEQYAALKQQILDRIKTKLSEHQCEFIDSPSTEISENVKRFITVMHNKLLEFYRDCHIHSQRSELWEGLRGTIQAAAAYVIGNAVSSQAGGAITAAIACLKTMSNIDDINTLKNNAQAFLDAAGTQQNMEEIADNFIIHLAYRLENLIDALALASDGVDKLAVFISEHISALMLSKAHGFNNNQDLIGYLLNNCIPENTSKLYGPFWLFSSTRRQEEKIKFRSPSQDRAISSQDRRLIGCLTEAHATMENGSVYIKEGVKEPFRYPPHKLRYDEKDEPAILGFREYFIFSKGTLFPEEPELKIHHTNELPPYYLIFLKELLPARLSLEKAYNHFIQRANRSRANSVFKASEQYLLKIQELFSDDSFDIVHITVEGEPQAIQLMSFLQLSLD